MRKSMIVALIIALVAFVIGVTVSGAALAMIGFDFKNFATVELDSGEYTVTEDFSSLDIHTISADVNIRLSEDEICRVEYATQSGILMNVIDGVFCVETEKTELVAFIGITTKREYINIYLPRDAYELLSVDTTSGDIYVFPAFDTVENATVSSTSGDISFIGTVSDTLTVESLSGDILIREPNAKIVRANATSGEITLNAVYATEVSVKTTSGDVDLDTVTAKEKLIVKTNSGEIELYCDAAEIYLESTSGDIEGAIGSEKNYIVKTTSGSTRIPPIDKNAGVCEIRTTSGDIEIKTAKDAVNSFDRD